MTQYLSVTAVSGFAVQLKEDAQMLGEVVVAGHLPKTKLTGEGLQMNVEGSVLANVGSAEDVLAKTPGIIKNTNGLEVIGKGSPLVYINGAVRRRVHHVNLVVVPESRACAAHSLVDAHLGQGQLSETEAGVGRVHAVLSPRSRASCQHEQTDCHNV